MLDYSIQDIEDCFEFRNLSTYEGDTEDPFTLHDILWPCVLENAHIEAKENNWERKFWYNYSIEVQYERRRYQLFFLKNGEISPIQKKKFLNTHKR